jgi:hypothetical protein
MFWAIFAHPKERKTVFYSLWYNTPKSLPAGGLERGGTDYVFGVKHVAHPQERKTLFYSMWYNAPKLLPAGGLERGGNDYVFGVKDVARATSFTPNT